jgi:hypothetical protein
MRHHLRTLRDRREVETAVPALEFIEQLAQARRCGGIEGHPKSVCARYQKSLFAHE